MEDADNRPPRLAPMILIGVLAWLAIDRPGPLGGESAPAYRLFTTLASVAVVGYVVWRFHGIIPAAVAVALLRLIDTEPPSAAFHQRAGDAVLLGTLGLGMAACARQGRPGTVRWILIAVGAGLLAFGWYGLDARPAEDPVVRDRLRHATLALTALAVLIGAGSRAGTWADRARLVAATVLIPALGIVAAVAMHGAWPRILEGGDWASVVPEWREAVRNGTWAAGAWCWTAPWVAGLLLVVGLWRTLARGRKQLRQGRPPLAWLVTAASLLAFAAVGGRPSAVGSLALAGVGAVLTVFGLADLILAAVERVELKPPEPGPSGIPRVK